MGADHSDLGSETFKREDWVEISRRDKGDIVWRHRRDTNVKIVSYPIFSHNQKEFKHQKQLYYLRKNNSKLVSALFLQAQEQTDLCSSNYKHQLYLENMPITLLDVEHIPYPDHLHLYEQCLAGFYQLATSVGCFLVQEEYIGITDRGVVKVWLNGDFHSSFVVGSRVLQEIMVRSIIDVIDKNVDHMFIPPNTPSVKNYLFRNHDSLTFQTAIHEFGQFVRNYNGGKLPSRLECIDRVGGVQIILNRESNEQESKNQVKSPNTYHQPPLGDPINGFAAESSSMSSESSKGGRQVKFASNQNAHGFRYQEAPILNVVKSSGQFKNENRTPSNHSNVRMIPQQQFYGNRPINFISNVQPNPIRAPIILSSNHQMQIQRDYRSPPRFIQPQRQIIPNPNIVGPVIQNPQPIFRPPLPVPRASQIIYQQQQIPAPYIFQQPHNILPFQQALPIFSRQKSVKTMPFTVEVIPGKIETQNPNAIVVNQLNNERSQHVTFSNTNNTQVQIQEQVKQKNSPITLEYSKQEKYQQAGSQDKSKKISEGISYRHGTNHDSRVPSFINQRQKLHSQLNKSQKDKDSPNQQKEVDLLQTAHNQTHPVNQGFQNRYSASQILHNQNRFSNIQSQAVSSTNSVQKYEENQIVANQYSYAAKQVYQQSKPILTQKEAVVSQYDIAGSFNPAYTTFMLERQTNNQQQSYNLPTKDRYEDISYGITANNTDLPKKNQYRYETLNSKKQYINADDGKSSEQFLSKLRSLQSGSDVSLNSISSSSAADFGNYGNYYESTYKNTIGQYNPNSYLNKFEPQKYSYGGSSYLTNNYNYQPEKHQNDTYSFRDNYVPAYGSKQNASEDQFAKSAISRMAPQSYPSEDLPPRQQYKFETNIDLAYSKTENRQFNTYENTSSNYTEAYKLYTQP